METQQHMGQKPSWRTFHSVCKCKKCICWKNTLETEIQVQFKQLMMELREFHYLVNDESVSYSGHSHSFLTLAGGSTYLQYLQSEILIVK